MTSPDTAAENERLAQVAAKILDKVGAAAVQAHRERVHIRPPAPGHAVIACRCGRMLNITDMCRRRHPPQTGQAPQIPRITCAPCADLTVPLGLSVGAVIRAVEGGAE
jgi:hypothetical protein